MGKLYDENGDVILTKDQTDLCHLANYMYDTVDVLFNLEDEKDFDIHPALQIYEEAHRKLNELINQ